MYDRNPSDATNLYNPDHGVKWSVNVTDDDTRTMTAAEVAIAAARGELDPNDTYVWRDGMGDWLPLGQCPELQALMAQYGGGGPAPYAGGQPAYGAYPHAGGYGALDDEDDDDLGSTRVAESPVGVGGNMLAGPGQDISTTMASPVEAPGYEDEDVFAAARPAAGGASPPAASRLTGARNEESSLFSIADLQRAAESEGKRIPAAPANRRAAPVDDDPFADLMAGAGGLAFEPPPLHAPAPPPPPPKPVVVTPPPASMAPMSAPASAYPMAMPEQRKSKTGLIIGAAAGLLLLVGGAVAFMVASGGDEAPEAKVEAESAKETKEEGKEAPPEDDKAEDEANQDDAETAEKSEDQAEDEPDDDDKAEAESKDKSPTAVSSTKSDKSTSSKKDDDKAVAKKEEKKEEKKEDEAKPKGEFNRDAARSALTAAAGAASGCKQEGGPTGRGQVTVTFAPSGRATQATVGPPFAGTAVGSCAAGAFRGASVPPFSGSPVTVTKSFFIK